MVSEVTRVLVDKEKYFINGKEHYRLLFFDMSTGVIVPVTAPVSESEVTLGDSKAKVDAPENLSADEVLKNAL